MANSKWFDAAIKSFKNPALSQTARDAIRAMAVYTRALELALRTVVELTIPEEKSDEERADIADKVCQGVLDIAITRAGEVFDEKAVQLSIDTIEEI